MHSTRRMNRPFVLLLLAFTDTHLNTVIGNTPRTCKFQQRGKTDGVFLLGSQRANASFKPSVKLPMMPGGKLALSVNKLVQREDQMQCSPTRLLQHTGSTCGIFELVFWLVGCFWGWGEFMRSCMQPSSWWNYRVAVYGFFLSYADSVSTPWELIPVKVNKLVVRGREICRAQQPPSPPWYAPTRQ